MKPIISLTDYEALKSLIQYAASSKEGQDVKQLVAELRRADFRENDKMEDDIVRINSFVEVEDVKGKRKMSLKIVLPSLANLAEKKISVLAPISIALLGFRKGRSFDWEMPSGVKTLRILQVKN